jgi:hypothetical protein
LDCRQKDNRAQGFGYRSSYRYKQGAQLLDRSLAGTSAIAGILADPFVRVYPSRRRSVSWPYSGKDVQIRRLSSIGILTPKTAPLSPLCSFDPEEWGEYVVVKPNNLNSGVGIKLVHTSNLAARFEELTASVDDQLIVESYIDHSEDGYPTSYRVMTMFGRALCCLRTRWGERRSPLDEIAANPREIVASNGQAIPGRVLAICSDPEIISLGERAHRAFPECPVLGVDIVHFSSALGKTLDPELIRNFYAQFNALELAADLLIEKTRTEAC